MTSLFGGTRLPKSSPRVEAYGSVDELNSVLGLVMTRLPPPLEDWRDRLAAIQSDCFSIGAILAAPGGEEKPGHIPELPGTRVSDLEKWIDALDEELEPLRAFVLPGGSEAAAYLHVARAVCRRAERRVVALAQEETLEPILLEYLNRLGDLLFVLARAANRRSGVDDVEWHPEGK